MTHHELIEQLRSHFTERLVAPRAEGVQQMARFLSARLEEALSEAYQRVDTLEAEGLLRWEPHGEPNASAMLEAARYGDMPAEGTERGVWWIGTEGT